jgi:DNA ligase-associated metallophosphoesterase
MLHIRLAGADVALHPTGGAYLPEHKTALVADAHFGKAVSYRRLGVPVPQGTTTETLTDLTRLVADTGARRIVFLGDFLHSARSHAQATLAALQRWRADHAALQLTLVRGNHDDRAGDPPAALDIHAVDEPLQLGPFALCHHPRPVDGTYVLAGHWHPCIRVSGRANDRLRLPCFWFGDEAQHPVGVLPAFGSFTGMHPVALRENDRVYVLADVCVRALPRAGGSGG